MSAFGVRADIAWVPYFALGVPKHPSPDFRNKGLKLAAFAEPLPEEDAKALIRDVQLAAIDVNKVVDEIVRGNDVGRADSKSWTTYSKT